LEFSVTICVGFLLILEVTTVRIVFVKLNMFRVANALCKKLYDLKKAAKQWCLMWKPVVIYKYLDVMWPCIKDLGVVAEHTLC
jgi:hypothetical protein